MLFICQTPRLGLYTTYADNYRVCAPVMQQLLREPEFSAYLAVIYTYTCYILILQKKLLTDPRCECLDLMSFLTLPIQRVSRYQLLLEVQFQILSM